jgi:hypothetical protein
MHETLAFYLLAMPLSLGRLVLGEIGSHNNLDAFLSSHENVSTFYDIIKARLYGSWKNLSRWIWNL